MPELPEVETIVRGLKSSIEGRIITDVLVKRKDLRTQIPDNFVQMVRNQSIKQVKRRAKYMLIELGNYNTIICHLGMSGTLVLHNNLYTKISKHDHVIFTLGGNGLKSYSLVFNDPRRFGMIDVVESEKLVDHKSIAILGPEPLSDKFDGTHLFNVIRKLKSPIKQVIMDGSKVVGVGNIYACESLFKAKISPIRAAGSLSLDECNKLAQAIKEVLAKAIEAGGSSLKDYRNLEGKMGYFQQQLLVYGREGESCYQCGDKVVRIIQGGRSTFFCEKCQKSNVKAVVQKAFAL